MTDGRALCFGMPFSLIRQKLDDSTEFTVHKGPSVLEIHYTDGSGDSVSPAEIPHPTRLTLFVTYSGDDVQY
jgi:hypothetical protein